MQSLGAPADADSPREHLVCETALAEIGTDCKGWQDNVLAPRTVPLGPDCLLCQGFGEKLPRHYSEFSPCSACDGTGFGPVFAGWSAVTTVGSPTCGTRSPYKLRTDLVGLRTTVQIGIKDCVDGASIDEGPADSGMFDIQMWNYAASATDPSLDRGPVPVISIGPSLESDRALTQSWLHAVHQRLMAMAPAGKTLRFSLGPVPGLDTLRVDRNAAADEQAVFDSEPELRRGLLRFLRSHVYEAWRALSPELETVSGNFEVFNPGIGANMGWHQDGHTPGTYLAHYYLDAATDKRMDWFEASLPNPLRPRVDPSKAFGSDDSDSDSESGGQFTMMGDDGERKHAISAENFVTFAIRDQALVLFEDSEIYHRTPLTALSVADLRTRRPIIRMDFYGRGADGKDTFFRRPQTPVSSWEPLKEHMIPMGMQSVCEGFAESQAIDINESVLKYVGADPDPNLQHYLLSNDLTRIPTVFQN